MSPDRRLGRDQHVLNVDASHAPALVVEPGVIIEIETWDCYGGQVTSEAVTREHIDPSLINAATGPIYVRGDERGDTLSVILLDIRPAALGAAICAPEWGQLGSRVAPGT